MVEMSPFCFVLTLKYWRGKRCIGYFLHNRFRAYTLQREQMHVQSYFTAAGNIHTFLSVSCPVTGQQEGSLFTPVGPGCDSKGQETRLSLCGVCSPHTDRCFLSVPWFVPTSKPAIILLLLPITKTLTWLSWSCLYMVTPQSTELQVLSHFTSYVQIA